MSIINFLKNLLWDDKINNVMNLIFLIANIFITALIYNSYIKDEMYKYSINWMSFNGVNILEILISFCFLILIQNFSQATVILISRVCRNGIKTDILKICEEKKLDIRTFFIGNNNEEHIKNTVTKVFLKFTVLVNESNGISKHLKDFMEDTNNIYIINRGVVMIISALFAVCYHFSYMNLFIITTSFVVCLLLLVNVFSLLMIEYRAIVDEFLIQDKIINDEPKPTT